MQAVDLYTHFYYERAGALRFPMDANGILYPGAGLAAYLNANPDLVGKLSALRAGLLEIGFSVGEATLIAGGDLRITLRLPDAPNADGDLVPWLLTDDGGGWRVSLPASVHEWPTLGTFTLATPSVAVPTTACINGGGTVVFTVPVGSEGVQYGPNNSGPAALAVAPDGAFWIADTVGNRLLHYDSHNVLLGRIALESYGVIGVGDVEVTDSGILVLDIAAPIPRVLRLATDGRQVAAYESRTA